jgi:8-oxo-dGTP diphosphatase
MTCVKPDIPPAFRNMVDLWIRIVYRVGHRIMRSYWALRRTRTHGALVAVWNRGELLLIKNSYRREYTLPGGNKQVGESLEEAATRELREECGITVPPREIRLAYHATKPFEHRSDDVTIFEIELETRPEFAVDNREVAWAAFKFPAAVRKLPLVPHLREYLDDCAAK